MRLEKRDFDAIVVGSGPNGFAAAIAMQQVGLSVLILEGKQQIGGGMRSAEFTIPGFQHDICSAIHPLAVASPFFRSLPLAQHGLEFIYPNVAAAHPLDDRETGFMYRSAHETAQLLGEDSAAYLELVEPLLTDWAETTKDVLAPLHFPRRPARMIKFGLKAILPATQLAKCFQSKKAKALWAGMAAHSMEPLGNTTTSAIALVLMLAAHTWGWPVPKGGSVSIANALASYFTSIGGKIETNFYVRSLSQLPSSHAVLFDVTPKQLLQIAGSEFSSFYQWQLKRYRYGMGAFKIDWALDGAIPFSNPHCNLASTVHLGNTLEEIKNAEQMVFEGKHPERPFVLLAQQSLFDPSRAPVGKQTGWAYCHVPNGSTVDMTDRIEDQIERFAPGFKDRIIARHVMDARQMEEYNPNYIGGDINGGMLDIGQLFTRPALRFSPYRTSAKGLYICSSSTPPGGGVHGMCGYHAAKRALKDIFDIKI
jgi:phytoene dehydrogenase-like protein